MKDKVKDMSRQTDHLIEHAQTQAGLLDKLFGTGDNARVNIAGVVAIVGVLSISGAWFCDGSTSKPFIGAVVPIITFALGCLFREKHF